jgi:hypothetical protein
LAVQGNIAASDWNFMARLVSHQGWSLFCGRLWSVQRPLLGWDGAVLYVCRVFIALHLRIRHSRHIVGKLQGTLDMPCQGLLAHKPHPINQVDMHHLNVHCRRDYASHGKWCCCTIFGCCGGCRDGFHDVGCFCARDAHLIWKDKYDRGVGRPKYRFYFRSSYIPRSRSVIKSWRRRTQDRDWGSPLICPPELEQNGLLCYPKCARTHYGVGPVCWQYCPSGTHDCGTYCVPNGVSCANFVGAIFQDCIHKYPDGVVKVAGTQVKKMDYLLPGVANRTKGLVQRLDLVRERPRGSPPRSMGVMGGNGMGVDVGLGKQSATPPACSSTSCFCLKLPDGSYPSPYDRDPASFITCSASKGVDKRCPTGKQFDGVTRTCVDVVDTSPACLQDAHCFCKGRPSKVYHPYNNGTLLLCVAGKPTVSQCQKDTEWSEQKGHCVFTAAARQPPKDPNCYKMECFCRDKPPGAYPDAFAPANSSELPYLQSYIQCTLGVAERRFCADGYVWVNTKRTCVPIPEDPGTSNTTVSSAGQPKLGPGLDNGTVASHSRPGTGPGSSSSNATPSAGPDNGTTNPSPPPGRVSGSNATTAPPAAGAGAGNTPTPSLTPKPITTTTATATATPTITNITTLAKPTAGPGNSTTTASPPAGSGGSNSRSPPGRVSALAGNATNSSRPQLSSGTGKGPPPPPPALQVPVAAAQSRSALAPPRRASPRPVRPARPPPPPRAVLAVAAGTGAGAGAARQALPAAAATLRAVPTASSRPPSTPAAAGSPKLPAATAHASSAFKRPPPAVQAAPASTRNRTSQRQTTATAGQGR